MPPYVTISLINTMLQRMHINFVLKNMQKPCILLKCNTACGKSIVSNNFTCSGSPNLRTQWHFQQSSVLSVILLFITLITTTYCNIMISHTNNRTRLSHSTGSHEWITAAVKETLRVSSQQNSVFLCLCIAGRGRTDVKTTWQSPAALFAPQSCSTMPRDRLTSDVDFLQPCGLELGHVLHDFSPKYLFMVFFFLFLLFCFSFGGLGVGAACNGCTVFPLQNTSSEVIAVLFPHLPLLVTR